MMKQWVCIYPSSCGFIMMGRSMLPRSVPPEWKQLSRTSLSRLDIIPWQMFNWILNEEAACSDNIWIKLLIPFSRVEVMMVNILEQLPWTSKGIPSRFKMETISSRRTVLSSIFTNCLSFITERSVRTAECKSLWVLAVCVGDLDCLSSLAKNFKRILIWFKIVS